VALDSGVRGLGLNILRMEDLADFNRKSNLRFDLGAEL